MTKELEIKLKRIRDMLQQEELESVLLSAIPDFFWITCGKNEVVDFETGETASKILVTQDNLYVVCSSSEQYRVMDEVVDKEDFTLLAYLWHEEELEVLKKITDISRMGSDTGIYGSRNISAQISKLRYELTEEERTRYKEIGPEAASILETVMQTAKPGEKETEIAGRITGTLTARGYLVPVCMVGSDERIFKYRHPVATDKEVKEYVMGAICAQKYGLTISVSRIISFVPLSEEIRDKYNAALKIDALYNLSTVPGAKVSEILKMAHEKYRQLGYAKDYDLHHQGGAIGYPTRDYTATEKCEEIVRNHQAFAWNPTIAGVKVEDTIMVEDNEILILSESGKWDYTIVDVDGKMIRRPLIKVLK